jgi:predicted  nucleic acid-binding Zn-ribbon protein
MSRKDDFIAGMQSRLAQWGAELSRLEAKLEGAEARVKDRYLHAVQSLRDKHRAIESKLDKIGREDSWEELRDEVERIQVAFKAGMEAIRDFSDHS